MQLKIKNLQLLTSSIIIIIVGCIYGLQPETSIPFFFDFNPQTTDLKNLLRSQMLLCFGFGLYWLLGVFETKHWKPATISNLIFMGFLAVGRLLSFYLDGFSVPYFKGFLLELFLFSWGVLNLYIYKKK